MTNNITVNHINHTITATKSFLRAASLPYTHEFSLLTNLMKDLPGYQLEQKKVPMRRKIFMPTYSAMIDYILTRPNNDKLLDEFEAIKAQGAAIHKNAYMRVRYWFLATFPELDEQNCVDTTIIAA